MNVIVAVFVLLCVCVCVRLFVEGRLCSQSLEYSLV